MNRTALDQIAERTAAAKFWLSFLPPAPPYGYPPKVRERVMATIRSTRPGPDQPRWMAASDDWTIRRRPHGDPIWIAERWGETVKATTEQELVERLTFRRHATAVYEAAGWTIAQCADGFAATKADCPQLVLRGETFPELERKLRPFVPKKGI